MLLEMKNAGSALRPHTFYAGHTGSWATPPLRLRRQVAVIISLALSGIRYGLGALGRRRHMRKAHAQTFSQQMLSAAGGTKGTREPAQEPADRKKQKYRHLLKKYFEHFAVKLFSLPPYFYAITFTS